MRKTDSPADTLRAAREALAKSKTYDAALAVQKTQRAMAAWRVENLKLVFSQ